MMGIQPPVITHTAATPQDSPNTTLDTGYREFNCRSTNPSLSIESIDRSASQCSIPGLLKPMDNKFATNNLAPNQLSRRISLVAVINPSPTRDSNPSNQRIQRGYSWRLSRPSLRRKKSQCDDDSRQTIVLNNGRNTMRSNSINYGDYTNCNGGYLYGSIRNDTHCDTPNNRNHIANNRSISPNNSTKSRSSSIAHYTTSNMRWIGDLSRQNSLSSYDQMHVQKTPLDENALNSAARTINNLSIEARPLPQIKQLSEEMDSQLDEQAAQSNGNGSISSVEKIKKIFMFFEPKGCLKERDDFSLYLFAPHNRFRELCHWFVGQKWFDNMVLLFIGLNCITLAMERPNIPPNSGERIFLSSANYVFTAVFAAEMFVKVVASGMLYGYDAYFTSGWNIMDGSLVIISIVDLLMSLISESSPKIFGILRVFRLLRSLRPLRVINRAPGLKLVVQTLLSSLRPIGNIVLICCTFFMIFGILGVQLFKGAFYYCEGPDLKNVRNKTDCLADKRNQWVNRKYNFDDLGKALMSLFVLSSRDGWVNIMYTGLDAVGVDQQPVENFSEWRLLYFIAFILLVGFFVLNMFVGVVVENFHRCREEQEKEERVRRAAKRALQMEKKRRKMHEPPYYTNYSKSRLFVHNVVTSKYFDLAIAAVIGLNVVTMAMEFYMMPKALTYALKIFNYFFTAVFILESFMKLLALGLHLYLKDKWNQLDVGIVILSIVGIVLEEVESKIIPINPTIIRVMRVLRIARVLKLLKMAKGIRALLDTVMQALPQVGNLGLLFFLLFFIFAALGVELFGRLECSDDIPCQGLGEHAHFSNFGMAFLTLFRVATGDNWNGIMKDTLRDDCDDATDCVKNCCVSTIIAPIFFVIFVLMAQFVLVNVVVAVLMKHLEESHKQMEDELDMETQLERELAAEQEELLDEEDINDESLNTRPGLSKVRSLPANFTYNPPTEKDSNKDDLSITFNERRGSSCRSNKPFKYRMKRRQTFHTHQRSSLFPIVSTPIHFEVAEVIKPASNLSVPRIISQNHILNFGSTKYLHPPAVSDVAEDKCYLTVNSASHESSQRRPPIKSSSGDANAHLIPKCSSYLLRNSEHLSKHRKSNDSQSSLDASLSCKLPNLLAPNAYGNNLVKNKGETGTKEEKLPLDHDLDVQSVINERRPSKLKCSNVSGKGGFVSKTNSFNHIYAREEIENKAVSNVEHDIRIYVDDTDSQSSERDKVTNGEEGRDCRKRSLGAMSNISLIKKSDTDVVSSSKEDLKNSQTNNSP